MGLPLLACALALVSAPGGKGALRPLSKVVVQGRTVEVGTGVRLLMAGTQPAPANCDLAVGPSAVVQVANGRVAFYDRQGALTFQQGSGEFFGGLAQTPAPQEPRAAYEPLSGRFVVVFVENDSPTQVSNLLVAVSDDSDPAGSWHQYRIDANLEIEPWKYWVGRPGLGLNSEGLCVTGTYTEYASGALRGSGFWVLPLAPLLSGDPAIVVPFTDAPVPYAQMGESAGAYVFGIAQRDPNEYRMYRASDVGTASPLIQFRDVFGAVSPLPPATVPSTGGAALETHQARVIDVAWRGDRLFFANNSGSSIVGIRHHVYDTSNFVPGEMQILASSLVSSPGVNYFMPAVALNKWGDAAEVFTGSSASVTSDVLWSGRVPSDQGALMSAPVLLASGLGSPYLDSRWGAYAGLCVDPVDGERFWGTAMAVGADGWWTTHLFSFFVSRTWAVAPDAFQWLRGVWQSGGVGSLGADDGDYNVAKAGLVLFPSEPPAQLVVEATAPAGQVLGLGLDVVAKVNTPGLTQRIELWNWQTGAYVAAGTFPATTGDTQRTVSAPGAPSDYVQAGTGRVRAKVAFFRTGLTLVWPWTASVDQARWSVRVR
jgi:hypothetical protein